ncbi:MAG: hypothetical protein U9N61_01685 [Euryarchaeota archaeon]|nr:hypothetical protein [Euryarchaeota archaeon]
MAGRKPYKPTKKHIETVRKMKAKGASDKECATAIGIARNTFGLHKKVLFEQAIKKGSEERTKNHLELAKDALALRLQQRVVEEKTVINRKVMGSDQEEIKTVEKVVQPSDTLIMFTLVNKSNGEWQSINKPNETANKDNLPTGVELVQFGTNDKKGGGEFSYD